MLRFILWSLLFYGIYRLIWPSQRSVSSTSPGQGSFRSDGSVPNDNGGTNNGKHHTNASHGSPSHPYNRVADREGEYIEYEELR